MSQAKETQATATMEQILIAKGIPMAKPGPKERGSSGGGKGTTAQTAPARKFAFAPRRLVQPILTIKSEDERREEVANLEVYRSEIGPFIFDLVAKLRTLSEGTDDEVALAAPDVAAIQTAIAQELNQEHHMGKKAALFTYADALVRTCPDYSGQFKELLEELVHVGLLAKKDKNSHVIYGEGYSLAEEYAKDPEAQAIVEALSKKFKQVGAAGRSRFETGLAALKASVGNNPLPIGELKLYQGDEPRRLLLETPDNVYRERHYRGGIMLLESVAGRIYVLDAAGGCRSICRQLAEAGVFVRNTQLVGEQMPPMKERLPKEVFRDVRIFHGLVFRGIAAEEKKAAADLWKEEFKRQIATEREILNEKATLTSAEFFLFGRAGTSSLDPLGRKPFEIRSRKTDEPPVLVWDVIALVERDEQGRIRVPECPERLADFFVKNREFVPAGEKFSGVAWPLNVLLRMGYAAAQESATSEQKEAARAEAAQTEVDRKAAEAKNNQELAAQLVAGSGEDTSGADIPDPSEGR